jgi:hypothetical protein
MDSFYIGNLKGVGKVYQLTAIDVATRWAVMLIVLGPVTASHTIRFAEHVIRAYRRLGVEVRCVLSDNGPEYIAAGFRAHLAAKNLEHADPATIAEPQRCRRTLSRHRAPRLLAASIPSAPVRLDPPIPSRSRRLADPLPPPPPQRADAQPCCADSRTRSPARVLSARLGGPAAVTPGRSSHSTRSSQDRGPVRVRPA